MGVCRRIKETATAESDRGERDAGAARGDGRSHHLEAAGGGVLGHVLPRAAGLWFVHRGLEQRLRADAGADRTHLRAGGGVHRAGSGARERRPREPCRDGGAGGVGTRVAAEGGVLRGGSVRGRHRRGCRVAGAHPQDAGWNSGHDHRQPGSLSGSGTLRRGAHHLRARNHRARRLRRAAQRRQRVCTSRHRTLHHGLSSHGDPVHRLQHEPCQDLRPCGHHELLGEPLAVLGRPSGGRRAGRVGVPTAVPGSQGRRRVQLLRLLMARHGPRVASRRRQPHGDAAPMNLCSRLFK